MINTASSITCISRLNEGEERCPIPRKEGSNFCENHYSLFHSKYMKYKNLERKAIMMQKNLSVEVGLYKCLKIHKALMDSYNARKNFRAVAIHPSAYDEGHDIRINRVWEWIEKCTSVLESIHEEIIEKEEISQKRKEKNTDKDAEIISSVVFAQNKSKSVKQMSANAKRRYNAIRKANLILKEEKIWTEFIPIARREREERKARLKAKLMKIYNLFGENGMEITLKELKWVMNFENFLTFNLYDMLGLVIADKNSYILATSKYEFSTNDISHYKDTFHCEDCLKAFFDYYGGANLEVLLYFTNAFLQFKKAIEKNDATSFTVQIVRFTCNVARFFFRVGKDTVIYDYIATEKDDRSGPNRFKPTSVLVYPCGKYDIKDECCKNYYNMFLSTMNKDTKYPVIIPYLGKK